jgi:hypothetical protein
MDFATNAMFAGSSGTEATLSAIPRGGLLGGFGGTLVAVPNYGKDSPSNLDQLRPASGPDCLTDTQFIQAILAAAARYSNNSRYDPVPSSGLGTFSTYNSNSYVSGVLSAAGGTLPSFPRPPRSGSAPGFDWPLPLP